MKASTSQSEATYPGINQELAMAFGDAFTLDEIGAFQLADFAKRCQVDKRLLKREAARLAKLAMAHAPAQAAATDYVDDTERAFAARLSEYVVGQAARLTKLSSDAVAITDQYL